MMLLPDAFEIAVSERLCDVFTGLGVACNFQQNFFADTESRAGFETLPHETGQRQIFADRAGKDRMPFHLQFENLFQRLEAHRALWPTVYVGMRLPVAIKPGLRQA